MNYYQSNLDLLRKKDEKLANKLEGVSPNLRIVLPKNRAYFPEVDLRKNDIIAILGFGLGEHIKDIIKTTNDDTFILIIENDLSTFKTALYLVDLTSILTLDRVNLSIGEDPFYATFAKIERYFGELRGIWKISIIENRIFTFTNPKYYEEVKRNLKEAVSFAHKSIGKSLRLFLDWRENVLENIKALTKNPGVDCLFGKFVGKPAILVSAGPSLDKNVVELKHAKGRALIIAVDTSLRTLLKHDIRPDFVVAVDGAESNYVHNFKGVDIRDTNLIAHMITYPEIIRKFQGPIFITDENYPLVEYLGKFIDFRGYIATGGQSTSHVAFNLARHFGCDPIIFVGQDLAYTGDATHTDGVSKIKKKRARKKMKEEEEKGEIVWLDGIFGGKVKSSKKLYGFLRWFEIVIQNTKTRYINATEGGAMIHGTEVMTLKEAIKTYCQSPISVDKIIKEARSLYHPPSLNGLIEGIGRLVEKWKIVEKIAQQGEKMANELIHILEKRNDFMKPNQLLQRLDEMIQKIWDQKEVIESSRWSMKHLFYKMKDGLRKLDEDDTLGRIEVYKTFFKGVKEDSEHATRYLKKAKRGLENECPNWR